MFIVIGIFTVISLFAKQKPVKSSDKIVSVTAEADGLYITKKHNKKFIYVSVCVKNKNTGVTCIPIYTDEKQNKFVYPFISEGETYEVFLQMQDKNWQNWTQTAPAVITANGGLGEYSISFSDYYYDNDTAAIILKNFEMQQPVNPVDDIFGVNIYYNGDWSKNYWKRLTFDCDGDKNARLGLCDVENDHSLFMNKSFFTNVNYYFSYEGKIFSYNLIFNDKNKFTDVQPVKNVSISDGTLIPRFTQKQHDYTIYGDADTITVTPEFFFDDISVYPVTVKRGEKQQIKLSYGGKDFVYAFEYKIPKTITFTDSKGNTKTYYQTFFDDFDGDKLENSKWTVRKDELRSWNEHAIKVKDGNLIITFSKVGEKLMCGGITTEGKFEQSHGLFEIRFKVDEISGMWYAFWLMDNNNNDAHIDGSASDAAEIDIFEIVPHPNPENKWMGGDNYFKTAINYDSYAEGHPVYFSERAPDVNDDFYGKWHTVLFLWGKENYELYIDGKLQYVIAGKDASGMCVGTNHIILSSECTGFGGILDETMMPASFTVDYLKVYSEK